MDNRTEKLRTSRNLNEVMDVVNSINKEAKKCSTKLSNMRVVLSAVDDEDSEDKEIEIGGHTGGKSGKIEIKDFTFKNPGEVKKNSETLRDMFKSMHQLEEAHALIKSRFAGQKGQPEALKAVGALKKNMQETVDKAKKLLEDMAKKHQPLQVEKMVKIALDYLQKTLKKGEYEKIETQVYVNVTPTDQTQFCNYINIRGLTDDQGFVIAGMDYYIIITGVVDKIGTGVEMYMTSVFEFRPPGKYRIDDKQKFDTKDKCIKALVKLLGYDQIHAYHAQSVLHIEEERLKDFKTVDGVKNVVMDEENSYVYVTLKANVPPRARDGVIDEIRKVIQAITSTKDAIEYQLDPLKANTLKFRLVNKPGKRQVNLQLSKLMDMKEFFDLTDEQVQAIKQAFKP